MRSDIYVLTRYRHWLRSIFRLDKLTSISLQIQKWNWIAQSSICLKVIIPDRHWKLCVTHFARSNLLLMSSTTEYLKFAIGHDEQQIPSVALNLQWKTKNKTIKLKSKQSIRLGTVSIICVDLWTIFGKFSNGAFIGAMHSRADKMVEGAGWHSWCIGSTN